MDGKPDPVSAKALKTNIAALAAMDLGKLQQLIDNKDWPRVINACDAIAASTRRVQNAASRIASRAAKQHWNPLLEDSTND